MGHILLVASLHLQALWGSQLVSYSLVAVCRLFGGHMRLMVCFCLGALLVFAHYAVSFAALGLFAAIVLPLFGASRHLFIHAALLWA